MSWLGACCAVAMLASVGCGDDANASGTSSAAAGNGATGGGAGAGGGGGSAPCPPDPPQSPNGLVCQQWQCEPQPPPDCWQCAAVGAYEGESCATADTAIGVCHQGVCEPLPDPGDGAGPTGTTANFDLALSGQHAGVTIPLTLFLPDGAGPFPVVMLHHGFQLGPELYASYGPHLASWGYVVVMPAMPGGFIGGPTHRDLKEYLIGIMDWVEASAAATDGPLEGKADPLRIGLAGHSMGGKISMLVATEDTRPRAVFGIDPVDAAGGPLTSPGEDYPSVTPELMDRISVPLGLLGETTNATCEGFLCQPCAPAEDNFQQYYAHAVSPAIEVEVVGAFHMSFVDNPDCGLVCSACPAGTDDPATTRRLTRRYMTAFFNVFLHEQAAYRAYLTGAGMAADVAVGLVVSQSKGGL